MKNAEQPLVVDKDISDEISFVLDELNLAVRIHPSWPTDTIHQVAIIQEECGELMREALQLEYEPHKGSKQRLYNEAVQTAAMALRFLIEFEESEGD